jgi:hypothetical protein
LKNENRKLFSGFKFFILARTFVKIRHHRTLEFVGSPNLPSKVASFARIWPMPESRNFCWNSTVSGHHRQILTDQIPAKVAGIRHKWPDSGHFSQNLVRWNSETVAGRRRILTTISPEYNWADVVVHIDYCMSFY